MVGGGLASVALGAGLLAVITTTVRIGDNEMGAKPVTEIPGRIEVGYAVSAGCGPGTVLSSEDLPGRVFSVDLQPAIDSGGVYDGTEDELSKVVQLCVRNTGTRPTAITYVIKNEVNREVGLCTAFEVIAGDTSCPASPTGTATPGELGKVASLRMSPVSGCGTLSTPTVVSFGGGAGTLVIGLVVVTLLGLRIQVVESPSMSPTVPTGALALMDPASPEEVSGLGRGDVIAFQHPRASIHRVVGPRSERFVGHLARAGGSPRSPHRRSDGGD